MGRSIEKKRRRQKPTRAAQQPEIVIDIAAIAALPDAQLEAGVHLALDQVMERAQEDPLDALGATLQVMQALNAELVKAYAPSVISNAQNAAAEAQATGKAIRTTREQSRAVTTLMRLEETMVKLGVARTKVRDEKVRRRRYIDVDDQ